MSGLLHGGLFIERDQIRLVVSEHVKDKRFSKRGERLFAHRHYRAEALRSSESATRLLSDCAAILVEHMLPAPGRVGVGCYGPFISLSPNAADYGRIVRRKGHSLSGISIPEIISKEFAIRNLSPPRVAVQTDVNVGAIGEAYLSSAKPGDITVYLMLTDGIGGGFARGQEVGGGLLHSEVGMVAVTPDERDILLPEIDYEGACSIGTFANTSSMFERARRLGLMGPDESDARQLLSLSHPQLWPVWQGYIAQLCLVFTAVLTPNRIVLAGPLMKRRGQIDGIRRAFRKLWNKRRIGARLHYSEMEGDDFISLSRRLINPKVDVELEGAIYMAMRAVPLDEPIVTELRRG